jgi:hypothetical protein
MNAGDLLTCGSGQESLIVFLDVRITDPETKTHSKWAPAKVLDKRKIRNKSLWRKVFGGMPQKML